MRTGKVTFKDIIAGQLTEISNNYTVFEYSEDWTDIPISCSFPISQRRYEYKNGLHPFFQNLCPEGWLREGQSKAALLNDNDYLGLLLHFGADCIGAVGVVSEDIKAYNSPSSDKVKASIESHKTISGVHKKLLAYKENGKFYPSVDSKPATHIAKFNTASIDTLVRNELKSLKLAQIVLGKDNVTDFSLDEVIGEGALLVMRFDRKDNNKLRMEEFAQILNKSSGAKYEGSYEDIASAISEYSAAAELDLFLYFKQLVFSIIIGNCDAHLKNFALLEHKNGLRLSPAYDLMNTMLYNGYDSKLALSICGDKIHWDKISKSLIIEFGKRIGLKEKAITLAFNELQKGFKSAKELLTPPPAEEPDGFNNRYKDIVDRSCLRILEE